MRNCTAVFACTGQREEPSLWPPCRQRQRSSSARRSSRRRNRLPLHVPNSPQSTVWPNRCGERGLARRVWNRYSGARTIQRAFDRSSTSTSTSMSTIYPHFSVAANSLVLLPADVAGMGVGDERDPLLARQVPVAGIAVVALTAAAIAEHTGVTRMVQHPSRPMMLELHGRCSFDTHRVHRRAIRYCPGVARCKARALSASSARGLFAGTPRHLCAEVPARDTHRSLVLPREPHHLQPAARLRRRSAARDREARAADRRLGSAYTAEGRKLRRVSSSWDRLRHCAERAR